MDSALYTGRVFHQRFRPRPHKLVYRVFWTLFDIDELETLHTKLRFFSLNRFNLFSFHARDHLALSDEPLRAQMERMLGQIGLQSANIGSIRVLCMPRLLGYVFNPISVWFCHKRDGALAAILYEVANTFGERHSYLIPVEDAAQNPIHQSCEKGFYVSPFLDMNLLYDFDVSPPDERVAVTVRARDADGPMIVASLSGARQTLTDTRLFKAFFSYPLLTIKVVVAIHWEALFIWLKKTGLRTRPPAPLHPVTIVRKDT